jgi:hypothetical protein
MIWKGQELEIRCPFTGLKLLACELEGAWVGVSQSPAGGWVTTLFASKQALIMFLATSIRSEDPTEPLSSPNRDCPMFGGSLDVFTLGDNKNWIARSTDERGHGYVTTQFYSEAHLDYFLSTRAGVPPVFSSGNVVVRERVPPPPPDPVTLESNSRMEAVKENAQEVMDKVGLEIGVLKPKLFVGAGRNPRKRG